MWPFICFGDFGGFSDVHQRQSLREFMQNRCNQFKANPMKRNNTKYLRKAKKRGVRMLPRKKS